MFWADKIAREIIEKFRDRKEYVIVTGTSMSGEPHIGNASDLIRGEAIKLALEDLGKKAKLVWVADDLDPFRSVPQGFPEEMRKFLGMPVSMIPDPFGCHESFAKHYEMLFLKQLKELEIEPEAYFGIKMYEEGLYDESKEKAMEKREEIREILNKYRKTPLPKDWYPLDVICENCKKIPTTKILSYDPKRKEVEYVCEKRKVLIHKKNIIEGCGHRGKVSIFGTSTKLTWRVEWASRWIFLNCCCEPFGKEHAAAGGSWDTAKEIVKILGGEPPVPVVYEHIQVEGEKMSKSKGNVITIPMLLEVMSAPEIKFWLNFGKITKARDISLETLPLYNAFYFDKAEKIYFGETSTGNEREDLNYKRAYELATKRKFKKSLNLSYDFAAFLSQIFGTDVERVKEILKKTGHYKEEDEEIDERLKLRLSCALNWVKKYAPEKYRIIIGGRKVELSKTEKEQVEDLIKLLRKKLDVEKLQEEIYKIARKGEVKEFFKKCYLMLIGREEGPRLANLILALGKEEVIERLKRNL